MKTVVITGGSRGIGAQTVRLFAQNAYNVYFLYKNSVESANALASETGATAVQCDIADFSAVREAFAKIRQSTMGIDILVNNAGISSIKPLSLISNEEWREMMAVTLDGAFYCSKEVMGDMINRSWGRIINVSSMWGTLGASCEVHYSTAKAGLIGYTKALSKELAPSGITVNCVAPGFIDTEMNSHLTKEEREEFINEIPMCRAGSSDEVAKAIYFLASDDASYITGQILGVNGGIV